MDKKKAITYLMVSFLLLSGIVVLPAPGSADVINPTNGYGLHVYGTDLDNRMRHRGENVTFEVSIQNGGSSTLDHCNMTVLSIVRDADGNQVESPFVWRIQDVNDDETLSLYERHTFGGFNAKIKKDAAYGTYNITVRMTFKDGSTAGSYDAWVLFTIGPRMYVFPDYGTNLHPGDIGHWLGIEIQSRTWETVHQVTVTVNSPDRDFVFDGARSDRMVYTYADLDSTNYSWGIDEEFKMNVTKDKEPGEYPVTWSIEYTLDGETITDEGHFNLTVRPFATIEMSSSIDTIQRGTSMLNITFTFTNTGNVDIKDLKVKLNEDSEYFMLPTEIDHYEAGVPIYKDAWVEVGDMEMGESVQKTVKVIVDSHIPTGTHKVLFDFTAEYDGGSVRETWGWKYDRAVGYYHYLPGWNGRYVSEADSLHHGAFIMFNVTGSVFDMEITPSSFFSSTPDVSLISEENTVAMTVENNEARNYRDLSFYLYTGEDSPFMNAENPSSEWSEPYNVTRLNGYGRTTIAIHVKLRPGTNAGYYDVPMKIHGTDLTASKDVDVETSTKILVVGSGAKPVITDISYGAIKAGKTFKVTLTVTNNGDDVAKNLFVNLMVSPDQNDIALINGAPKVESLSPGESVTLEYTFIASPHISSSHAYPITAEMTYDNMYRGDADTATQQVGVSATSGSVNMGDIISILLIILLIMAIIGGALYLRKGFGRKKESLPPAAPSPAPATEEVSSEDQSAQPEEVREADEPGEDIPTGETESQF